ncbi:MAG: hypothetical protein IPM96_02660 [Ignavibacteria bacterium]|nr:hypothetical protein [Ignavibacteria bacterium]
MKTPFTADQFLEIFKNYNQGVFPMQIVFYMLSIIVIYLTFRPTAKSDKIISGLLAFFWLWMGVVYQLYYFTEINNAAYLFGVVFILQSILFLTFGVFQNKLSFNFRYDGYGITGIILILFALIIYPVLGYSFGHVYPYSPTFGLPCPTTILTFGLLLLSDRKCPLTILIIPFAWSIVGFTAAFSFGIIEDIGLLVSGLLTIIMVLMRNRMPVKKRVSL